MNKRQDRLNTLKYSIKNNIENAAIEYSKLTGETYLFVYGNKYVEIAFLNDRFAHLTGIKLFTSAHNFYNNSKNKILSINDYGFDNKHRYENAKKKPLELIKLTEWLSSTSIILENVHIKENVDYTIGLTNGISFIFEKEAKQKIYKKIVAYDGHSKLPNNTIQLIDPAIYCLYK